MMPGRSPALSVSAGTSRVSSTTSGVDLGGARMTHKRAYLMAVAAIPLLLMLPVSGAGPTFRADYKFTGTALTAFKPVGQADWKVQNGEIVGTPKDANGGWLLLDAKGFQDTQMY